MQAPLFNSTMRKIYNLTEQAKELFNKRFPTDASRINLYYSAQSICLPIPRTELDKRKCFIDGYLAAKGY